MRFFKDHGILGLNARNLQYIGPYNPEKAVRLADDKLKTKSFLSARGIPVPKLYGTIRSRTELERFDFSALPTSFVIKPNQGSGGEGILPIWDRSNGFYLCAGDTLRLSQPQFEGHIADILDGRFSISGISDIAFFEQRLICDPRLAKFAYKGLPDIRVVVFNLVPVMAMLRLPTRKSQGKANLHQGAVGVGIDIGKGETTHIVQGSKVIEEIPEVGPIRGFQIPYWDDILNIASRIQWETNVGYMAVDIALDDQSGPVLLEINARAGLALQIANLAPLKRRLERVKGLKVQNPEKAVRLAKDMFGNVWEREIKHRTGKEVLGIVEPIKLLIGAKPYRVLALIDPHRDSTQVDARFARERGLVEDGELPSSGSIKMKFILGGRRRQTLGTVVPDLMEQVSYPLVIGRRDLNDFWLDPSRFGVSVPPVPSTSVVASFGRFAVSKSTAFSSSRYREWDELLCEVDERLRLLFHLKPLNLEEQRDEFLSGRIKNPQFTYPELAFDPYEWRERLEKIDFDDSSLGQLFSAKRAELLIKIDALEARGTSHFADHSERLFGTIDSMLLEEAEQFWSMRPSHFQEEGKKLPFEVILERLRQFLQKKGLSHWSIQVKPTLVADCMMGKDQSFLIRQGVEFTEARLAMVIAHEIETHLYTAENGRRQPYRLFQRGTANYLLTQEGMAIHHQEQAVDFLTEKHFWNAGLVLLVDQARQGNFRSVFEKAVALGYTSEKAFQSALKTKRGMEDTAQPGAFTKDLVYFKGRRMVKDYLKSGGDWTRLYLGKLDLTQLSLIEQVPGLVPPGHLPESF